MYNETGNTFRINNSTLGSACVYNNYNNNDININYENRQLEKTQKQKRKIDPEYSQQLELVFKPEDATTEHINHWQETELNWWAERQLGFVAIASLIQLTALGFMMLSFFLIDIAFS